MSSGTPRETSSATTRLVLGYVRDARGEAGVARVVARSGVPHTLAELEDASGWVSYETRCRLFEATVEELGDPRAMFAIGASVVTSSVNASLLLLLRALGSPAQVFRSLPRAVSKFSTTSTMSVLESSSRSATVSFELHEGYEHSRLDCDYARGLISSAPVIFGLPPAHLVHDVCQGDGHPACIYHATWSRRHRWSRGRRADDVELIALRQQLDELQSAATDLVSTDDLSQVLSRITSRASASVLARGYVLAVVPSDGGAPLVHSTGVAPEDVDGLAAALLRGEDLGPNAVVVDVASARRHHGRLAALHGEGQVGLQGEHRLLDAYASHAAAALDLLIALDDSRRDGARSQALLALAHSLADVVDVDEVAVRVTAALPLVVGCASAGLMLWDASSGQLRTAASVGLSPEGEEVMLATVLQPQDVPELVDMVTTRRPVALARSDASPLLAAILSMIDVEHFIAVPLMAGDELLGVATASWGPGTRPLDDARDLTLRLQGVADQASTALQGARLLATVRHQATHDALTGLPNRVLLTDRVERALEHGSRCALLFCDLDRFKEVNDTLGHAAGDEVLRQVAARLLQALPDDVTVGRLSGDEFAVLVDAQDAERCAQAVVQVFERPFVVEGRDLRLTTSVGLALSGPQRLRPDELLGAADHAMYAAKLSGRNQISRATSDGSRRLSMAPPALEDELRTALQAGQLRLQYQPVVRLPGPDDVAAPARVVAVEALVRWEHPRLGLLAPGAFLSTAEDSGLVVDLDLWVLGEATRALVAWPADAGPAPVRVAVNLSSRTLADPRLRAAVLEALARSGLAPSRLELEVVESRALVDLPAVAERLTALRHLGVSIALDDFGTGFSTLSWLHALPVDRLKLDRAFTSSLLVDPRTPALVQGVLALADRLGLEVVAEGVETEEQLAVLRAGGCSLFQGYLLARPGPLGAPTARRAAAAGRR